MGQWLKKDLNVLDTTKNATKKLNMVKYVILFNKKLIFLECCDGKFVISNENPKSITVTASEVTNKVTTEEVATIAPDSAKKTRKLILFPNLFYLWFD